MLGEQGVETIERHYFKQKPTVDEVTALAAMLPGGAFDILSTRSRRYKEMNLSERELTEAELIGLLAEEPGLWRRPVITDGKHAVVGYDENALKALLG